MKKFKLRKFYLGLINTFILLFLEVIFKMLTNNSIFNINIIYIILFSIILSCFLNIIERLFNNTVNKILFLVNIFLWGIIYSIQLCIYKMFGFYFEWSLFGASNQVMAFAKDGLNLIIENVFGVILLMLPFILYLINYKKINIEKDKLKNQVIKLGSAILLCIIFILSLGINKDDDNSAYNLFYNYNNVDLNIKTFGVLNSFIIDTSRSVIGFNEKIDIIDNKTDDKDDVKEEVKYQYNNLDIDFDKLINEESDEQIKEMHEYFQNEEGTKQNEYTNYFKGKNLILFMAESFNEIAVDEVLTPTLYKLVNSGFKFNNFYTPTISSTIGGEFQELTGLVAASGFLSPWKSGTNKFPMGIANSFKNLDYNTYAYHDHNYTFQNRYKYLASLGFTNFTGCKNGLEEKMNCNTWPESDIEMINATFDDYINSEKPFFTYYVTVSGHGDYSFSNSATAKKNKDLVSHLNYSEKPLAYLASQIELDRALKLLIEKLTEAGKLDDTVIALVGDHYPYYLSLDEVNEISKYKKDDTILINKSNFILWNNKMDTINIDKVGSQIDVLPTIYNLFGVKYDSRLIIGKDILSTEPGLAIFGNRSWVTDKGSYNVKTKEFIGDNIDNDYISYINKIVNHKVTMSKNIMVNDYYKKVLGE